MESSNVDEAHYMILSVLIGVELQCADVTKCCRDVYTVVILHATITIFQKLVIHSHVVHFWVIIHCFLSFVGKKDRF